MVQHIFPPHSGGTCQSNCVSPIIFACNIAWMTFGDWPLVENPHCDVTGARQGFNLPLKDLIKAVVISDGGENR